jgi:serine/threonine-protein kinase
MTECLDEEAILSFCQGSMPAERRPAVEAHIAQCDECRALVSAVMRSSFVDPSEVAGDPAPATPVPPRATSDSAPKNAPVAPGDVLAARFVVERVLGVSGISVVVAAKDRELAQRVALKFLHPAARETPDAAPRFLEEAKAAARITSEHAVRITDTGMLDNGAPYLVMEHLDGSDLGAHVAARGSLPWQEAVEYVLQACEAVVEGHELGIFHRDLKPANLFLTKRKDGSPLVKVLDFGLSKAIGDESPRYMSPEQLASANAVDARTDVWAIGIVLYELVTGKPVWQAETAEALRAAIATAPAPPLRVKAPLAPLVLEEVVARCLAKSPNERIAGIADLVAALEPIAPLAARTSVERVLRVAPRAPAVEKPPSTSLAVGSASPPSASIPPKRSGARTVAILASAIGVLVLVGIVFNVAGRRPESASAASPLVSTRPPAAAAAPSATTTASDPHPPAPPDPRSTAAASKPERAPKTVGTAARDRK